MPVINSSALFTQLLRTIHRRLHHIAKGTFDLTKKMGYQVGGGLKGLLSRHELTGIAVKRGRPGTHEEKPTVDALLARVAKPEGFCNRLSRFHYNKLQKVSEWSPH
jgi:hypothetical protein